MKKVAIILLVMVGLIVSSSPLWAWGEVKKAKQSLDMGLIENAIEILDSYLKKHPTDLDANLQLGRYFLLTGNAHKAMDRFNTVIGFEPKYKEAVGSYFQEAAQKAGQQNPVNCQSVYNLLVHAYNYNPNLASQALNELINYGDMARAQKQYGCAEQFYALAKQYGPENIDMTIAHRYLYLAALGHNRESLIAKAMPVVGNDFIEKVFPKPRIDTVFEKSYTFADAYDQEYGQIETIHFGVDDVQVGDRFEVTATLLDGSPFQGNEIFVWRGENFSPKWAKTNLGIYSQVINDFESGKFLIISLAKRKDVAVTIKVTRNIVPSPNLQLIASL